MTGFRAGAGGGFANQRRFAPGTRDPAFIPLKNLQKHRIGHVLM
jgi:hypothetical protein